MGRLNEEFRFLDFIFKNEGNLPEVHPKKWNDVIAETYESAQGKNKSLYEMACRRFRKKEFYIKTCVIMGISPAKYYRLLRIFFKLAERCVEKFFTDSEK